MAPLTSEMKLDPGASPRRRSKCRQCLLWTFVAVVCLFVSFFGKIFVSETVRAFRQPQARLYQDLSASYKPNEVVRPLIDSNQTFDIVATVWVRKPEVKESELEGPIYEEAIFSDTVFRDLRIQDKHMKTSVNLSVPTKVFKNPLLWNYDLRATFVLVPNPPSPLTYAVNYSSWIPPSLYFPPMRTSSLDEDRPMADKISDSFGILVPLLEFHPVASKCEQPLPSLEDATDDDDDNDWDMQPSPPKAPKKSGEHSEYRSTSEKPVLESHPYISTRTHIHIVDVTAIFNRLNFEKAHNELASQSCGQSNVTGPISWKSCQKSFIANGNLETKVKLRVPRSTGRVVNTEWAYAPYMTFADIASGPMDLVPAPVNREACLVTKPEFDEPDFMNITWNIAFSSRTPLKLMTVTGVGTAFLKGARAVPYNSTTHDQKQAQETYEFISGVFGYKFDDNTHPRFLFLLKSLRISTSLWGVVLDFHYWFTRSSTAGISIRGAFLRILGILAIHISEIMRTAAFITSTQRLGLGGFIWAILFRFEVLFTASALWMLKTITRAEFKFSGVIPRLHFALATHTERASERIDARASRSLMILAYVVFSLLAIASVKYDLSVTTSQGFRAISAKEVNLIYCLLRVPSAMLGYSLQLLFNYRAKTFAGVYRLTAWMVFLMHVTDILIAIPGLFRRSELYSGVSLFSVIETLLAFVSAWQALKYIPASQKEDVVD